jgi:phage terminase large subunit
MKLKLKTTNVFKRNFEARSRVVVNQGGTGSSKTYSIAQLFIVLGLQNQGKMFSIVRKSMPTLRATAMRDFMNLLLEYGLYSEDNHNKTQAIYNLNGNQFEFFGLDEPQKVRSRRRDYLWLNEGNEMTLESFRQLNMRTSERVYIDFNPSDEFHWIYDEVLIRPDAEMIKSTYRDNPFLPELVVKEIERYKEVDSNYWNIYGLGERGVSSVRIFTNFEMIEQFPDSDYMYGLDFGFNHPTALVKVAILDDEIYAEELIYESGLTNSDLIKKMEELKVSKSKYLVADSEDTARIEEIRRAGFNVKPAKKGSGSVGAGIDLIKRRKVYLTGNSPNLLKESRVYSWKTKGEEILDEPVKTNDDGMDALRYPVYYHFEGETTQIRQITSRGQYQGVSAGI